MAYLPRRRVAVTVFCEAPGGDDLDAAFVAATAIRQAIRTQSGASSVGLPRDIPCRLRDDTLTVTVVHAMESGMAAGNGYLWTGPTAKAYREIPTEQGGA